MSSVVFAGSGGIGKLCLQPHLCCLPSIVSEFLTHAADFGLLSEAEVEQLLAAMPDHTQQAASSMVRAWYTRKTVNQGHTVVGYTRVLFLPLAKDLNPSCLTPRERYLHIQSPSFG